MANFDSNAHERLLSTNRHANHQRRTVPQHLGDGLIDAFPPAQRSSDQKRNMVNSEQDRWLQELKARMGIIQNVNSHGICSRTYAEASNSDFGEAYKRPAPPPPQPPLVISPFHYSGGAAFIPPNFLPVTPKPQARLYEYGDCSETLPLSVAASFSSPIGPAIEVHSLAAFTSQLCDIKSIAEDGTLDLSIPLKEPCKNCKSLMERIPGRARILAGSGMSDNVQWAVEKRGGNVHHKQLQHILSGYNGFSYSAAYAANEDTIYETLKVWTLQNDGALRADVRTNLATMWHEFIAPYRTNNTIFRLNASGLVDPIWIPINNTAIPICTVFCAIGYILSNIFGSSRGYTPSNSYFLPLMAILAKWCQTLCPWGFPNVISIVGITSWTPYGVTRFLLGTTKPALKPWANRGRIQGRHMIGMRQWRSELLRNVFGWLPDRRLENVYTGIS